MLLTGRFTKLFPKKPRAARRVWTALKSLLGLAVAAQVTWMLTGIPRAEDDHDRVDFKYMYYTDKNGVWNHTPAFDWINRLSREWTFQWGQEFDVVSGASRLIGSTLIGKLGDHGVDVTSGSSRRVVTGQPFANTWKDSAFDAVSGASKAELRHSENPSITYSKQGRVYTAGFYFSDEHDYRSYSPSLSIAHDFNDRNTTLSAVGSWFFDDFHPQGAYADQGGSKQIQSLTLSATQVLTPLTMVSLTGNGIYSHGYLGHPYNPIPLDSGYLIEEHVPGDKTSWAISGQLVQGYHIGDYLGSFHLEARHYLDTWALTSNDAELQWYQYYNADSYLRLRVRGYAQEAAGFYKDRYAGNEVYRSVDIRYSKFSSLTLGAKISMPLFEDWKDSPLLPDHLDLSYDFGIRDTHGDQGTATPYAHYQLFPHSEFYTETTIMLGLVFDL